ncbi:hypothetical protein [Tellurirhabdus rosea]|uniref:hypothetical protein n=1 Tax=Tellurirhabdus rosea TaxID=2674997 RepID=UPI00225513B4|nr:hypothetical protein [Tellurirhabdus rosea]
MERAKKREFYGYVAIIVILALTQLYSVYVAHTANLALTLPHYLGFAATGFSTLLLFVRPNWVFYALGITLALGVENILGFTPTLDFVSTRQFIGNLILPVGYQQFSIYMLLVWAYFSFNRLRQIGQLLFVR